MESKRLIVGLALTLTIAFGVVVMSQQIAIGGPVMEILAEKPEEPKESIVKTDEEWKEELTPEQYRVLRQDGTERPFGRIYKEFKKQGDGSYICAGCNSELFSSKTKFDSGSGWPSFYEPSKAENVRSIVDASRGMVRTEVRCAGCDGHLGHVFEGENYGNPTDQRFCINGSALKFVPAGAEPADSEKSMEEKKEDPSEE